MDRAAPFGNRSPGYSFTIPARDENGFRALEEIRGKGINLVADAVAQSADHVKVSSACSGSSSPSISAA